MRTVRFALLLLGALLIPALWPAVVSHAEDVTPEVPIVSSVITGVRVSSGPDKTRYFVGEDLVITGAKLRIDYSDGTVSYADIKNEWCSGFDSYTVGTVTVSVKYPDWEDPASFNVEVVYPSVKYITIKTNPRKLTYYTGQSLDPSGIAVTASYENGYTEDVSTAVTYSQSEFNTPAESLKITVSYRKDGKVFSASFNVKVIKTAPESLNIVAMPAKTDYLDGEDFDADGLSVAVIYNDGSSVFPEPSEISFEGFDSDVLGEQTVTVTCRGVSAGFSVTVSLSPDHEHIPLDPVISPEPTCTEPGKSSVTCRVCGEVIESEDIPALGHRWGEWEEKVSPAYQKEGSLVRVCEVCGAEETETLPPLSRSVSDGAGGLTFTLEGEGTDCFPSGTSLTRENIREMLTQSEVQSAEYLASTAGGIVAEVCEVKLTCPEGSLLPDGNLVVRMSVPEGDYLDFSLFIDGKKTVTDYSESDRALLFVISAEERKTSSVYLIAGVPRPPETTAPLTTEVPEPVSGDETTSSGDIPYPPESATASSQDPETSSPDDRSVGSDSEDAGEGSGGMTPEQFRKTVVTIGIVIAGLLVLFVVGTLLYKRFID